MHREFFTVFTTFLQCSEPHHNEHQRTKNPLDSQAANWAGLIVLPQSQSNGPLAGIFMPCSSFACEISWRVRVGRYPIALQIHPKNWSSRCHNDIRHTVLHFICTHYSTFFGIVNHFFVLFTRSWQNFNTEAADIRRYTHIFFMVYSFIWYIFPFLL